MRYVKQTDTQRLLQQLRLHWRLLLLSFIGCMGLATAYLLIKNKDWNVLTTVAINENKGSSGSLASMAAKAAGFSDILGIGGGTVDNEFVIIQSHTVIRDAVKELGLNVTYQNRPKLKRVLYFQNSPLRLTSDSPLMGDTLMRSIKFKVKLAADGQHVSVWGKDSERDMVVDAEGTIPFHFDSHLGGFTLDTTQFYQPGKPLSMRIDYTSYTATAQGLMEKLDYDLADKKANVIEIALKHINPAMSIALLDAIVRNYEKYSLQAKNTQTNYNINYLQGRIDSLNIELAGLEYAIENYKQQNKLSDLEVEMEVALKEFSSVRQQQLEIETQYEMIRQLERYVKDPSHLYSPVPLTIGIDSREATSALATYNEMVVDYQRVLLTTKADNPARTTMQRQVESAHEGVVLTVEGLLHGIEFARAEINSQMREFERRIKQMPRQEREYIELKRMQELKQKVYVMLLAQQEQNIVQLLSDTPRSQTVDAAYCEVLPAGPKTLLILASAFIFALFLPVVWLKLCAYVRPTIDTPDDLSATEGIGDIYTIGDNEADIQALRSAILTVKPQGHTPLVVVVSMQTGEGRTTMVRQLAQSLAQTGRTVGVVNADLRNTTTPLGAAGDERVKTYAPSFAPAMLDSEEFRRRTTELRDQSDVVLIDTAAYVDYPDALPAIRMADVVALVVRRGVTRKSNLIYAESLIAHEEIEHLVTIFVE